MVMPLTLDTLAANDTLANLQATIAQTEAQGYELITFGRGVVNGQKSNTVTYRSRAPGDAPGPLSLLEVPRALSLPEQETAINNGEAGGKRLISYAAVLVGGNETNVAAYRG
jgi:hypothetical protein